MNPLAAVARKMCLQHLRSKGIDPQDSEDSDEASEALRSTKRALHRAVDELSHQDLRDAAPKRGVKKHVAAGSTEKVSKKKKKEGKKEKKEKKDKKAKEPRRGLS